MSRGVNAGNRNQGSNWCSKAKRAWIHARDEQQCAWCGRYFADLTLDHIVPRSKSGSNATTNLITSCMSCNRDRGDMPALEYVRICWASTGETLQRLARAMLTPQPRQYAPVLRIDAQATGDRE